MKAGPKTCQEVGCEGKQGVRCLVVMNRHTENIKHFTIFLPGDLTGQTGSPLDLGTEQAKSTCDLLSPPAFPNLVKASSRL